MVLVKPSLNQKDSAHNGRIPHKTYGHQALPRDFGSPQKVIKTAIEEGALKAIMMINEQQKIACDSLLNDTELLQDLTNFDLIVHEHFAFCSVLVAELLGIPRVIIVSDSPNSGLSPYFKIPLPVSYVPSRFSSFTDKMSFIERLVNLGMHIFSQVVSHVLFARSMSPLKDRYNITPEISYHEAFGNAELVIFHADFAFEYAQPLLPGLLKHMLTKTSGGSRGRVGGSGPPIRHKGFFVFTLMHSKTISRIHQNALFRV